MESNTDVREKPKLLRYFINGELMETTEHMLTVVEMLTDGNFVPVDKFELSRDADGHVFEHEHQEVTLHEDERFTAKFRGPTPTS